MSNLREGMKALHLSREVFEMSFLDSIYSVDVWFKGEKVGVLSQTGPVEFKFRYDDGVTQEISKTIPLSEKEITYHAVHPVFQMAMPEGTLLEEIKDELRRNGIRSTKLGILAFVGSRQIGCLNFTENGSEIAHLSNTEPVSMDLFNKAENEFVAFKEEMHKRLASGVAGTQPKFLASVEDVMDKEGIRTFADSEYIVKSYDVDMYPCLTVVEHISMELAKKAGIDSAETILSDQGNILFVKRFDVSDEGDFPYRQFEEFCSLMGKQGEDKYKSGYDEIADKMIEYGCSEKDMKFFFRQVVFNCAIRNGDAHLKNFGIMIEDGVSRLTPAYDIVATGAWHIMEKMALSINKSFDWPIDNVLVNKFAVQKLGISKDQAKKILEDVRTSIKEHAPDLIAKARKDYAHLSFIDEVMDNFEQKIACGTGEIKDKYARYHNIKKMIKKEKQARTFSSNGIKRYGRT